MVDDRAIQSGPISFMVGHHSVVHAIKPCDSAVIPINLNDITLSLHGPIRSGLYITFSFFVFVPCLKPEGWLAKQHSQR